MSRCQRTRISSAAGSKAVPRTPRRLLGRRAAGHAAAAGPGRPAGAAAGSRGRRARRPGEARGGRPARPAPLPTRDPGVTDAPAASALRRFLGSLAARDTSPHTQRSYEATLTAYLAWLEARGMDWQAPSRGDLRTYLAVLGMGRARSSTAQRLAAIRSFHRFAAREGLAP